MSEITEAELFEAILSEREHDEYNPDRHLIPEVAAGRWNIDRKTALTILAADPRLKRVDVRNPKTGRLLAAFVPA